MAGNVAAQAFYRKWRSQRFADLVGQDHVARTLRNAVRTNRIAHAYVFCGPRGVGKTSAARILAKAVNCPNVQEGEPCASCDVCQAIQDGRAIDVLEIDAASNRGIDEIRGIREKVGLAPASARYKFYILDEAHMLTVDAFNALLKTLEEPPPNTVFVLVTTEAQRLPETVLSRCQRLDFRRIKLADAVSRLGYVCQQEGIEPETGVLDLLARSAAGSLRDAESVLDQVVSFAGLQPTLSATRAILGAAGPEAAGELLETLARSDVESALRQVNTVIEGGIDSRQFALDLVECLRSLLLLRTSDGLADLLDVSDDEMTRLRRLTQRFTADQIVALIRLFTPGPALRNGLRPQLPLEMSIVEAGQVLQAPVAPAAPFGVGGATPPVAPPIGRPVESIRSSVRSASAPVPGSSDAPPPAPRAVPSPAVPPGIAIPSRSGHEVARSPDHDQVGVGILWVDVSRQWNEILDKCGAISRPVQALLRLARPISGADSTVVVGFPYDAHRQKVEEQKNRVIVEDAIAAVIGQKVRVECTVVTREALAAVDPMQTVVDDPVVKAAVTLGARVRSVTDEDPEEKE